MYLTAFDLLLRRWIGSVYGAIYNWLQLFNLNIFHLATDLRILYEVTCGLTSHLAHISLRHGNFTIPTLLLGI